MAPRSSLPTQAGYARRRARPVAAAWRVAAACSLTTAWLAAASNAHADTSAPLTRPAADSACNAGNLRISADGGFDYRRDKVLLLAVVIYECGSPLRIEAQRAEASSLDFDNSTWTFTGAVKLRMAQGDLTADTAVAKFVQQKLSMATFNGAPATFEQQAAAADVPTAAATNAPAAAAAPALANAHGHARTIVYNLSPGEVQLIGDAWLSNGCNELTGDTVIYNLVQKSITGPASSGPGGRVRGVIRPQCKPASATGPAP